MITVNPSRNVLIIGPELSFSIDRPDASKAKKKEKKRRKKNPGKLRLCLAALQKCHDEHSRLQTVQLLEEDQLLRK